MESSDESGELKGEPLKVLTMVVMVNFFRVINHDALLRFIPIDLTEQGGVISIKQGLQHRGIIINEKKSFPYSTTLYVRVGERNINVSMYDSIKKSPKAKVCGAKNRQDLHTVLQAIFEKVDRLQWYHQKFRSDLQQDPSKWERFRDLMVKGLQMTKSGRKSIFTLMDDSFEDPTYVEFIKTYFQGCSNYDSVEDFIDIISWFVEDLDYVSQGRPEYHVWPCMFKTSFQLPFHVDYIKLRDTVNRMFVQRQQRDFIVYSGGFISGCVIHVKSPVYMLVYQARLGRKKNGITNVTISSPGYCLNQEIKKLWHLFHDLYYDIAIPLKVSCPIKNI